MTDADKRCSHDCGDCTVEIAASDGSRQRVPGVKCDIAPHPMSRTLCAYCCHNPNHQKTDRRRLPRPPDGANTDHTRTVRATGPAAAPNERTS